MKQNILEIPIPEIPEAEASEAQAGVMYEHNATALRFLLPEALCLPEYRYYAEFVTVSGVARTDYLEPNAEQEIFLPLPLEITAQMTALCVFQVVKIGENGKTEQKITAKTVRLYFSPLENTEKLLNADYAFSVNALLEAIRKNTFRGEKGEKGDAYILTQGDKAEIAAQIGEAFYGLPLRKRMTVRGQQVLSGASDGAAVSVLTVQPSEPTAEGIREVQIAVGENQLSALLRSEMYQSFPEKEGNYVGMPINLKPETEYILAKLSGDLSIYSHSYLKLGTSTYWFCHKTNANLNSKYRAFSTPSDGPYALYATYIYQSETAYQNTLDTDWAGLTLLEKENSVLLQKTFSVPLYAVSAQIGDSYDFVSGTLTRRTAKAQLTAAQLVREATVQLGDSAYRYRLDLPADAATRRYGCRDGCCAGLPTLSADIPDAAAYEAYKAETGVEEGVWFGAYDTGIYIISKRNPEEFAAWLAVAAPEILYASVERTESDGGSAVSLPHGENQICVSPHTICADLQFCADISAVANDLESRIARLENNI